MTKEIIGMILMLPLVITCMWACLVNEEIRTRTFLVGIVTLFLFGLFLLSG